MRLVADRAGYSVEVREQRMNRLSPAGLIMVIVFFGWLTPANTSLNRDIAAEGAIQTLTADGVKEQQFAVQRICDEDDIPEKTSQFLICFKEFQANDLHALSVRFRELTDAMFRQFGLCIDRYRSEMVPCADI